VNTRHLGSLDHFHQRELHSLEKMARSDRQIAVVAAVDYCQRHRLRWPIWLVGPATQIVKESVIKEKPGKRGRSAGPLDRYRQDAVDYARYEEVDTVRDKQEGIVQELRGLRSIPNAPAILIENMDKTLAWVGKSLEQAFECASMLLKDTFAFGGPDAVKASYFKVKKAMRNPDQAYRYHMLDAEFLIGLGMKPVQASGKVRKLGPLFDLTF
jgi:hypothetical protein